MAAITLARAYQHSFDAHPNWTLAVTGGCLNALGDCVAQVTQNTLEDRDDRYQRYDYLRTLRFFAFVLLAYRFVRSCHGTMEHLPRKTIPPQIHGGNKKVSLKALGKRVAADQMLMAPVGLGIFLGSMGLMEGRNGAQIKQKYTDLYPTALLANWRVWPAAQLVNFRYMPLPYRVPFSQTCGVFWTLYLSLLNAKEDDKQDRKDKE
ncbi:hypothetical protein BDQ17DRAFT_1340232 [Cyathus striatus]|nr:hypothetical protein BDQ17DRAFT_1340232 [Cyathus striatus]